MKPLNDEKRRTRREYWRELIAQQEKSGTAVQAFCAQQGVTEASFYSWRKQLRATAAVSFALVAPHDNGPRPATIELVLTGGERIQVAPGADAATLKMVLAVLRERA
jgi:transposase-like protein